MVGSRQVQLEDRKVLHFTNAVVHETQRLANISPTSLPHRTCKDVTFQGHFIPKVRVSSSGRTGSLRSSLSEPVQSLCSLDRFSSVFNLPMKELKPVWIDFEKF